MAGAAVAGGSGGSGASRGPTYVECTEDYECVYGTCQEFTPGGFRGCVEQLDAIECLDPGLDECCETPECPAGQFCAMGGFYRSCKSDSFVLYNKCLADECTDHSECTGPNAFCAPRGAYGYPARRCVSGSCLHDADCTARGQGICARIYSDCCQENQPGLHCVYLDATPSGCRNFEDCDDPALEWCVVEGQEAKCITTTPSCFINGSQPTNGAR